MPRPIAAALAIALRPRAPPPSTGRGRSSRRRSRERREPSTSATLSATRSRRARSSRPEILAYVPASKVSRSDLNWWGRSWDLGYREIGAGDIQSQLELVELAADVGLQLGRGHCKDIADPLEAQFRDAQTRSFDALRARIASSARAAAADSIAAWKAWKESR